MDKIAILILAAGSASRMGKVKQLLSYKHTTLLGYAIEQALKTPADAIYCVLGAGAEDIKNEIRQPVKTIYNPNWEQGMGSSIAVGIQEIEKAGFDYALIMLADQPRIDAVFLTQLMGMATVHKNTLIASDYGSKNGVPALFPKSFFDQLKTLDGDQGARQLLNSGNPKPLTLIAEDRVQDIDTPDDYSRLLKN
ncbi:nucleotidyltransferase family protein [Leeuwenhoekiella nanhaiensis]|uniref:MobA-like NTP transferase domain-containing protein n=1 Tax=Leeuwenhoekiella nanhaiensis TaxID=1655491 RepID=A0A2G1VQ58_9FLAO|nr:nucleotidyltransferase family protein [Leeuwenhoekiella nanhaiensis]PHQ28895.1 hypothetical protein CJ305_11920 [Leeuwenhoekiella nanhaiensis]